MGLQMLVVSGSSVVMIGIVNGYGISTAAAYGVTAQLWSYIQLPAMALGAAVSAMAAQNIGANRWDRVAGITRTDIAANIALTSLLVVVTMLADRFALSLFLGTSSEAIPIAQDINKVASWSFVLFGVMMVVFGTVRATGAVVVPLIFIAVSPVGVRIGFVLVFENHMGADAIWWSFAASSAVFMSLALAYYLFGNWRKASMVMSPAMMEHETRCLSPDESCQFARPTWIATR